MIKNIDFQPEIDNTVYETDARNNNKGGVKTPLSTIHSRHVYKASVTSTVSQPSRLQCESKKVAPLKLFVIFSLVVNLCN